MGCSPGKITGVGSLSLLQGSSPPRDWTLVWCIAGGRFIVWVTREAPCHEYPAEFHWINTPSGTSHFLKKKKYSPPFPVTNEMKHGIWLQTTKPTSCSLPAVCQPFSSSVWRLTSNPLLCPMRPGTLGKSWNWSWPDGRFDFGPGHGASKAAQLVKNPPAMREDLGLIPGSGRSPGEGKGYPLQDSCLENPMDRGAWRAPAHRVAKCRTQLKD